MRGKPSHEACTNIREKISFETIHPINCCHPKVSWERAVDLRKRWRTACILVIVDTLPFDVDDDIVEKAGLATNWQGCANG